MPRIPTFQTAIDEGKRISIAYLKKNGYLDGYRCSSISWYVGDIQSGAVGITVDTHAAQPYMELSYIIHSEEIRYQVDLVRVPSNLGKGFMWMFVCPFTQKRCRILYEGGGYNGDYFTHREAVAGGLYDCQMLSKNHLQLKRFFSLTGKNSPWERMMTKHFKHTYRGKPTKRKLKVLRDLERSENIDTKNLLRLMR